MIEQGGRRLVQSAKTLYMEIQFLCPTKHNMEKNKKKTRISFIHDNLCRTIFKIEFRSLVNKGRNPVIR